MAQPKKPTITSDVLIAAPSIWPANPCRISARGGLLLSVMFGKDASKPTESESTNEHHEMDRGRGDKFLLILNAIKSD
ncbi:hypothetical protein V1288_005029 [Bradyrhizobium sp. AZCC 2176]